VSSNSQSSLQNSGPTPTISPTVASPVSVVSVVDTPREQLIRMIRARAKYYSTLALADTLLILLALTSVITGVALSNRLAFIEEALDDRDRRLDLLVEKQDESDKLFNSFRESLDAVVIDPKDPLVGVKALQNAIETMREGLRKTNHIETQPQSDLRFMARLVSAWIGRLSIVICGLFLVQVLFVRYRYNTRISNQYDAMADSLMIAAATPALGLEQCLVALTPKMDFGHLPKHIVRELSAAIAHVTDAAKK